MTIRWVLLAAVLLAPTPALAEETESARSFLWHVLNFVLFVGVLFYLARTPVRSFLAERRHTIEKDLETARGELDDAKRRLAEWRRRNEALERELAEIRAAVRAQAEAERDWILEETRVAAERVRRDAAAAVEQEMRRLRETLRGEAGELAVAVATELLSQHTDDVDRERLVEDFVQRIEESRLPGPATGGS